MRALVTFLSIILYLGSHWRQLKGPSYVVREVVVMSRDVRKRVYYIVERIDRIHQLIECALSENSFGYTYGVCKPACVRYKIHVKNPRTLLESEVLFHKRVGLQCIQYKFSLHCKCLTTRVEKRQSTVKCLQLRLKTLAVSKLLLINRSFGK